MTKFEVSAEPTPVGTDLDEEPQGEEDIVRLPPPRGHDPAEWIAII